MSISIKKLLIILFILISSDSLLSQEIDRNIKSISYIVDFPSTDKHTLYLAVIKSISLLYNDANNVIQMKDKESGTIILKGSNEVGYLNFWWIGMPKSAKKIMKEEYKLSMNHTLDINIKDDKLRAVITYTSLNQSDLTYPKNIFDLVDLSKEGFKDFDALETKTINYLKEEIRLSDAKTLLCLDEMYKSVKRLNTDINLFSDSLINEIIKNIEVSLEDDW